MDYLDEGVGTSDYLDIGAKNPTDYLDEGVDTSDYFDKGLDWKTW